MRFLPSQLPVVSFLANAWLVASSTFDIDKQQLVGLLSDQATISNPSTLPRWSQYDAPSPAAIVNVANEDDVKQTVYFAAKYNIPFLVQNGGNGWSTTLSGLNSSGIIINLAALKNITFSSDRSQVTIQGGTLVGDVVAAGSANSALIATGVANCVGTLGAMLGGGLGSLMGEYGLGVDQILNLRVVTPVGSFINVNATSNTDLWFAFRGAGPNFGIVTSATLKSYPVTKSSDLQAWRGPIYFPSSQLQPLITALGSMTMDAHTGYELVMSADSTSTSSPPQIALNVFYHGTESQGRAAFNSVLSLSPTLNKAVMTPYGEWNDFFNASCNKGGASQRKPTFSAGLAKLDPPTWQQVYNNLAALIKEPGASASTVTLLAYPLAKTQSLASTSGSSYPWRENLLYHASLTAEYTDAGFDVTAQRYGFATRDLWRASSGLQGGKNETYINYAYGDEAGEVVYGDSLARLQQIKAKVDPLRRFGFWFGL